MTKRRKLSKKKASKTFKKGNGVHRKNSTNITRGGYRL